MRMLDRITNILGFIRQIKGSGLMAVFLLLAIMSADFTTASAIQITQSNQSQLEQQFVLNQKMTENQQQVTLELDEVSLVSALRMLAEKVEVGFSFQEYAIPDKKVSARFQETPVYEALDILLKGTNLEVALSSDNKTLIIRQKLNQNLHIQLETVSGTVTDAESGETLPGVNVMVKGTTTGTSTDSEGNYELDAPSLQDTLVFSFVGYQTQEVSINGRKKIEVSLKPQAIMGEEMVVVGYGTQQEATISSSVSTVSSEDIQNINVANSSNALTGRIPGVITVQNSGGVGNDATQINIRGISTIGNSSPLVIVDGVRRNSLNEIDFNSVKSYTVLKDASAVAQYGMAGANGVILVNTKSGREGKPQFDYNATAGFQSPTVLTDYANAYEYASAFNQAQQNMGIPEEARRYSAEELEKYQLAVEDRSSVDRNIYANTNTYDYLLTSNSPIIKHNLSVSGGTDQVTYYAGANYLYQEDNWATGNRNKYGLLAKMNVTPTDKTDIKLSINGYNNQLSRPSASGSYVFNTASNWLPTYPVRYTNGNLAGGDSGDPLTDVINKGDRLNDEMQIMSQVSIEQELIQGLRVKGLFAYDYTTRHNKHWTEPKSTYYTINRSTDPYSFDEVNIAGKNSLSESQFQQKAYTYQGSATYDNTFGNHNILLLGLVEIRTSENQSFGASRSGYELPIDELSLGSSDKDLQSNFGRSSEARQVGYVYRVNYDYDNRYFLEATGRYDGHYYFAPGQKYGFFPAFSAGWRIIEENFMNSVDFVDNLKLRASWGEAGNLAGGPNQYSSTLNLYGPSYPFGNSATQGVYTTREGNPNITWERSKKYNVGIDFSMWESLLSGTIDVFYERRNNMLLSPNSTVPVSYGIGLGQVNAGKMNNRGIEVELQNTKNFNNGLQVSLTSNFTYVRNELIEVFENPAIRNDPLRSRTGDPYNALFGLVDAGLFQESDDKNGDGVITSEDGFPEFQLGGTLRPGDVQYKDINGDGVVDLKDEKRIGYPATPEITYSISPRFAWKNFDLSFMLQGTAHSSMYLEGTFVRAFAATRNYPTKLLEDSWTPQNTDARFPMLRPNGLTANSSYPQSTFWMIDSSYLRLKYLEFGYNLPQVFLEQLNIRSARIFFSGTNILTWSDTMDWFDPEVNEASRAGGGSTRRGWYHPQQKVYSLGINIGF